MERNNEDIYFIGIVDKLWWPFLFSLKNPAEKQSNLVLKCLAKFVMTKLQLINHIQCYMEQMPLSVYIWKVKYLFKARIINNNWLYFSNTELWFSIVDNIWSLILKIYWIGEVEVWTSKCLLFQVMTFIKLLCVFNAYILPFSMCITVK